jgi:hypothetical protein
LSPTSHCIMGQLKYVFNSFEEHFGDIETLISAWIIEKLNTFSKSLLPLFLRAF